MNNGDFIIKRITDYDIVKKFASSCELKVLNIDKSNIYYGLFKNNSLVSMASIHKIGKSEIRLKSNYTPIAYRGNGYMTALLKSIMKLNPAKKYSAYCMDSSVGIYLRLGFEIVRVKQNLTYRCWVVNKKGE